MMKKRNGILCALLLLSLPAFGETKKKEIKSDEITTLTEGMYSATIKALVCGGCGPLIEKTLRKVDEIESVKVNSEPSLLELSIKKESIIKREALQNILDKAAKKMGMGADFSLAKLKRIEEKALESPNELGKGVKPKAPVK